MTALLRSVRLTRLLHGGRAYTSLRRRAGVDHAALALGAVELRRAERRCRGRPGPAPSTPQAVERLGARGTPRPRASRSSSRPSRPVADRPPHVLLDQAAGQVGAGLPSSSSRARLRTQATISAASASASARGGLGVADAHLDGAEGVVRAHRPPQLGELDDRARCAPAGRRSRPRLPVAERRPGRRSAGTTS